MNSSIFAVVTLRGVHARLHDFSSPVKGLSRVIKGLMMSFYKIRREGQTSAVGTDLEERLRKIEAATSGLIMEVTTIREKERFMAKLQAAAPTRETQRSEMSREGDLSPMVTQSIPVIPRASR